MRTDARESAPRADIEVGPTAEQSARREADAWKRTPGMAAWGGLLTLVIRAHYALAAEHEAVCSALADFHDFAVLFREGG